ncbi:hypothetical protein K7X08_035650 [Anisodus acutangulus]|uniref:ATP-dependent RNA helicase n=1 Tax=Anisodus acutangulus TaxID=402998 RepID=A0A9Q1LHX5_9SOLA|nr:hypothetical protein K7X08_035650 [Anisodus acutangulus]
MSPSTPPLALVMGIIISPTTELSSQILHVAQPFISTLANVRPMLLVGGLEVKADIRKIEEEGANLLIWTLGRLYDIIEHMDILDFRDLEILILDEDEAIRHGIREAAKFNYYSVEVRAEAKQLSGSASSGNSTSSKTPSVLHIEYLVCESDKKSSQLVHLLTKNNYVMTCACVDYWGTVLPRLSCLKSFSLISLHGKMKQSAREKALASFTSLSSGILLCTDVAARGLDIAGVDHIIQYDPPQDDKMFIHRVGRMARLGDKEVLLFFYYQRRKHMWNTVSSKERSDILEKGLRAFVSYIRAYKEHNCSYILRWKELEIGKLGMDLLQLKISTWRRSSISFFIIQPANNQVWIMEIRQFQCVSSLSLYFSQSSFNGQVQGEAKKDCKRKKLQWHNKNRRQRLEKEANSTATSMRKKTAKQRRATQSVEDKDEITREYRLLKQLKKGAINENEFAKLTGTEDLLPDT